MITDIPSHEDFHTAAASQLYLAWRIAIATIGEYDSLQKYTDHLDDEETSLATQNYWKKAQNELANGYGLVQHSVELALKGRIVSISPYLLINREPKDWPKGVETRDVPFSEFRTLDSADLVRVHNSVRANPLDDDFVQFWNRLRQDRNKIMHSIPKLNLDSVNIIRDILQVSQFLFSELSWPAWLIDFESEGKLSAYYLMNGLETQTIHAQLKIAVSRLSKSQAKKLLNFDIERRSYACPECRLSVENEYQNDLSHFAQLLTRSINENRICCIVCQTTNFVQRVKCNNQRCKGNVVFDNTCLTCLHDQDSPADFQSALTLSERAEGRNYTLNFASMLRQTYSLGRFASDQAAQEHARRAMVTPHLQGWERVSVYSDDPYRAIGTWLRDAGRLSWMPDFDSFNDIFA